MEGMKVEPMTDELMKKVGEETGQNEPLGAQNGARKKIPAGGSIHLGGSNSISPRTTGLSAAGPHVNVIPNQLTIFYGGSVSVFDGIPADKIRELLLIAAAAAKPGEVKNHGNYFPPASPVLTRSPSMQSTSSALASPLPQKFPIQNNPLCKLQSDLPIARRHSLQRFFEKRRDRLVNKAPYPSPAATCEEKDNTFSATASAEIKKSSVHADESQLKASAQIA